MPIDTISDYSVWLTIATFIPLLGVLAILFVPSEDEATIKTVAILTAAVTFVAAIVVAFQFDYDKAGTLQFYANHKWIDFIHANYTIGLDGISLPLFVLSGFITFVVLIYTWDNMPEAGNPKAFVIINV